MTHTITKVFLAGTLGIWGLVGGLTASAKAASPLDGPAQAAMADTLQHALENNPTHQPSEWVDPDTGRAGGVVPVRTFEDALGRPCREFTTTIFIGGREEQGYGTACRQPDGPWQIVADAPLAPPTSTPEVARDARAYPTPVWYYPYGFYGPSHIYSSFPFVLRHGHRYPGHPYRSGFGVRHHHPLSSHERIYGGSRIYGHYPWGHRRGHRGKHDLQKGGRRRGHNRGGYPTRYTGDNDHRGRQPWGNRGGHRGRGRGHGRASGGR